MSDWELDSPSSGRTDRDAGDKAARTGDSGESESGAPTTPSYPPLPSRRRTWLLMSLAGLGLLVVGAFAGFYTARSYANEGATELERTRLELSKLQKAHANTEERNWYYYRVVEALRAENEELMAELQGTETPGEGSPSTTTVEPLVFGGPYGDGIYRVGEDIVPGTYDGVVVAEVGYWARLRGTDGSVGSITANAIVRGPFVLTVTEGDRAVELRGVVLTSR